MRRSVISFLLAITLTVGDASFAGAGARPAGPDDEDALRRIADTENPAERARALRDFVKTHPAGELGAIARLLLVPALIEAVAPADELVDATRAAVAALPRDDERKLFYGARACYDVALALAERGERLDAALELAQKAVELLPPGGDFDEARAECRLATGVVLVKMGRAAEAAALLAEITAAQPENQAAWSALGDALARAGKVEEAIEAYVRAAGVFAGEEVDRAPLEALFRQRHGSLAGLDERIARAKAASLQRVALDGRRADGQAPEFQLADLGGKTVKLSDLRGQVVVLDFWGTWCPPCREELPHIQALHASYAGRGVRVIGMNYEQPEEDAARMRLVRDFVASNNYTFPVLVDHEFTAGEAYGIEAFPTVVVVDKTGRIRYRNEGFSPGIAEIIRAQVDSLLS
jgi:thiol-disulfide isomerase/thioredoxin/predicted negative regulator of RcsB-dependent stress response